MPLPLVTLRAERLLSGDCRHVIDGDLRARRATAAYRGVHVATPDLALADRWHAAFRVQRGDGWLSHRSAVAAVGLPWLPATWLNPSACVDMTVPPGVRRRQRDGLRLFWHPLPDEAVAVDGVLVTPVARSLVDLLRDRVVSFATGVTLIDGALRVQACSLADLSAALGGLRHSRGIQWAASAIAAARQGVDSPGETRMRLALIAGGIRPDDLDVPVEVRDLDGLLLARGDFGNRQLMLWGEYDGFAVHSRRESFRRDRQRDRWLERRGWHVMRFSDSDVDDPAALAREWLAAVATAPSRILAMDATRSPELKVAQQQLLGGNLRATRSPRAQPPTDTFAGGERVS